MTLTDIEAANLLITRLDPAGVTFRYHHLFAELLRRHLHATQPDTSESCTGGPQAGTRAQASWPWRSGTAGEGAQTEAMGLIHGHVLTEFLAGNVPQVQRSGPSLTDADLRAAPGPSVSYCSALVLEGLPEAAEQLLARVDAAVSHRLTPSEQVQLAGTGVVASGILGDIPAVIIDGQATLGLAAASGVRGEWVDLVRAPAAAYSWEEQFDLAEPLVPEADLDGTGRLSRSSCSAPRWPSSGGSRVASARRSTWRRARSQQRRRAALPGPTSAWDRGRSWARCSWSWAAPPRPRSSWRPPARPSRSSGGGSSCSPGAGWPGSGGPRASSTPRCSHSTMRAARCGGHCRARCWPPTSTSPGPTSSSTWASSPRPSSSSRAPAKDRRSCSRRPGSTPARGQFDRATVALEKLGTDEGSIRQRLAVAIGYLAVASAAGNDTDEAASLVLDLAEPEGFVLVIPEAGAAVLEAVCHVGRRRPARPTSASSSSHARRGAPRERHHRVRHRRAQRAGAGGAPLPRHRVSYRESPTSLYVSVNTVKTHVKNIIRKLQADSRADAIKRARALHYL